MKASRRRRVLQIVETDNTFERAEVRGEPVWVGKCIHCRSPIVVGIDGEPFQGATIEHIVPRTHGGTDDLQNLALACYRCNSLKGMRLDVRRANDPKLVQAINLLRERRMERWRAPREGGE